MDNKLDISNKYSRELDDIYLTLQEIEREVNNDNNEAQKEYLVSITKNVREKINELVDKIQYNKESIKEKIEKNFPE